MAAHCSDCDYTYLPPRLYCERCFAELIDWIEIPPEGIVYAFTVMHMDLEEQPLEEPEIIAFVRFAGIDGGLIFRMGEAEPEEMYLGMPVQVVFEEEREGSWQDIAYLKPS
jgi:uncharacterized OB-fold protein